MSRWHVSRRTALRTALQGLGVSIGLPWLESVSRGATTTTAPLRMAFMFVPNGVHIPDWTPSTEGFGYELPYVLEPLAKVRNELTVLTGLAHDKGRANGDGAGDHARSASVFLTGAQPRKTDGNNIRSGISVDQVAAQARGHLTRFASLELGCEQGRLAGDCDSGYSCAYSSNVSWASPSSPMGKETNPQLVFQRLFGNDSPGQTQHHAAERAALRKSILDYAARDARRLQNRLSKPDQHKLDEYLTGIRDIERRIAQAGTREAQGTRPVDYPAVPAGIPDNYSEHLRLMFDMLVLAFQSDSTRIGTFMLANAGSNRSYQLIDIPDGHHDLSHHGGDPEKHAKIRRINRFHMEHFAHFLEKLQAIPEGNGTLLDHCMIVYGSGLSDGNAHNHDNLPLLLAGRGGGTLDPGRHLRFEAETPVTNLFMSLLDRFGTPVDFIGDSTGMLPGLQV